MMSRNVLTTVADALHGSNLKPRDVCLTPMSQSSTAPSTPLVSSTLVGVHHLSRMESLDLDGTVPEDQEVCEDSFPSLIPYMPPLQSELGRTAEALVKAETRAQRNQPHAEVVCFGLPALQSDLARWAKAVVDAEEWLEKQQRQKKSVATYVVDNTLLRATTVGLAYRHSKNVHDREHELLGPSWGSTVQGVVDGNWLKVGDFYLPIELEGTVVLRPLENDSTHQRKHSHIVQPLPQALDGPALTPDGLAVDLEDGRALFFSFGREESAGNQAKIIAKAAAKSVAEVRAREAGELVSDEEVCSIGADGVVRGPLLSAGGNSLAMSSSQRAKLFRKKVMARKPRNPTFVLETTPSALMVDEQGHATIYLYLDDMPGRHVRRSLRISRAMVAEENRGSVFVVDASGQVLDEL